MKEISEKLNELKNKATSYTSKPNESMRNIGFGMMEVINEVEKIISKDILSPKIQKFMRQLKYKVLLELGVEGVMIDSELRYEGSKICGPICKGGRTNKEYYDRLTRYLQDYGYDVNKFKIVVGEDVYIQ